MRWLICTLSVFALWILLFLSLDPWVIGAGVVIAAIIAAVLGRVCPATYKALNPIRWLFFAIYLPYFLFYCVKANIDVMLRVIAPDVPIRPGIVKVRTTLTGEMAKTFLANSITLTPGTLTVDIDGQDMYIHWINIDTDDPVRRTAEICGRFEPLLRRIFE
ncbi:MAG: Na+/H+ antiporter subunit E [Planctomycetota bacterium]|nr:Na+/H+ antiporter subunit E [Planctomycetota bacterium]